MTDPELEPRTGSDRRRRIPLLHLIVLALFTVLVAPLLRPPNPDCSARVSQVLESPSDGAAAQVLRTCRRELERTPRERDAESWAELQLGVGALLAADGKLGIATDAHRSALLVLTRERNARCWASIHYT